MDITEFGEGWVRPGTARRPDTAGVYARIAQRPLAMATAIWHNWAAAEPEQLLSPVDQVFDGLTGAAS